MVTDTGLTPSPGPVLVTDTLPTGLHYTSATGAGWTCAADGQVATCTHAGPLARSVRSTITLTVDVLAAAYPQVVNSVFAAGPGSTTVTATDTAPVRPLIRLRLVKRLASHRGATAGYQLVLHNDGPNATIAPLSVVDPLPAGLVYLSASGAGWDCGDAGSTVTCRHSAAIKPGGSAAVTLRARVTAAPGTKIDNIATASSPDSFGVAAESATSNPVAITAGTEGLATTGVPVMGLLRLALVLLISGAAVLLLGRRRTS